MHGFSSPYVNLRPKTLVFISELQCVKQVFTMTSSIQVRRCSAILKWAFATESDRTIRMP
jgi:hypothetical protein